jgi:ABC-2 type transport system permease protein
MELKALIKKEFKTFFYSPLGFIFIVVFLLVANFLFLNNFFLYDQASLRGYFSNISLMFVFLTPALTMRSLAEEKKQGTQEVLFTLPLQDWQIIAGKFLANLLFLLVVLALTLTVPLTVAWLGGLDWGQVLAGYLGMILLGGLYLAIGLYISNLTNQQISAFLIALFINFILFLSGESFLLDRIPGGLTEIVRFLSPTVHLENFIRGVVDVRDLLYYLSLTFVFLFILIKNLTLRRYD